MTEPPTGQYEAPVSGTAAGVPYVAWPPEPPAERAPAILLWHGSDPPRTPASMAAALPLHGLPAWRIYLGLPMFAGREPEGGMEELQRRAFEDALLKWFGPAVEQAVAELPEVLTALRAELPLQPGPIGLGGYSLGGMATLLALAESPVPIGTAAVINGMTRAASLVTGGEQVYKFTYEWTDASRALADRLDFTTRGADVAARDPQPAVLFTAGGKDPLSEDARAAHGAVQGHYKDPERVGFHFFPELDYSFVPGLGATPVPQSPESAQVDEAVTSWFSRYPFAHYLG